MRLLLVEDEKRLADALVHILKKHGYEVDISYDGDSGLDNALTGIYDVIILDRMLPGMNGIDVIAGIREEGISTPVIFLTAIGGINEKINGLDAGADDYLVKPFSNGELLARIRALGRRKDKDIQETNILSAGRIQYNSDQHIITCNDEEVKITFKEAQLLELLLLNKNQILSKDKIFDKVWGFNTESEITIVEIYIHHLRKKILWNDSGIKIETIRGVGYRLKEE
ncbi:MAG: response regulator transcription factor [Clostridiales bacterium]|nr:response regulator transcription factor [Clostridiales bacterium]